MDCDLHAIFDEMCESFHSDDEIRMEDTHREIMKHWLDFLSAGFDATKVAAMMPPREVYTHYDVLISHGAKIDATELAFELEDADYVKEHLAEFALRGADIDRIAKEWFEVDFNDDIKTLLEAGVDEKVVFSMSNDYLIGLMDFAWIDELIDTLCIFSENGFPIEDIKEWVFENRDFDVNYSIVWDEKKWKRLGIEATDEIIKSFLNNEKSKTRIDDNIAEILEEKIELPDCITPEQFLEFVPIDELMHYSFETFFMIGGSVEALAEKFLEEKGYRPEQGCIDAMFELISEDPTVIDLSEFVNCCNKCTDMTDNNRRSYYDSLSEMEGIDKAIIAKLL